MKIPYEDLLSGSPVYIDGIGHFRSPLLEELKPSGIGFGLYNVYIQMIVMEKKDLLGMVPGKSAEKLSQLDTVGLYDIVVRLLPNFRETFRQAMQFFMVEELAWVEKEQCFHVLRKENGDLAKIGEINKDNFDMARKIAMQMNYMGLSESSAPKFSSEKARMLWELTQEKMKSIPNHASKNTRMGNIISKICALGIGYTFHNIYQLTVYQLYDLFMQAGFLRASDLNEMAFSNHGGDKFKFEEWMRPITDI